MKKLTVTKKYTKFTHRTDSRYELDDYDDDGIHVNYTEIDKDGFGQRHKVLIKDKKEWDFLCEKYPI
jgi:hypothetical protein